MTGHVAAAEALVEVAGDELPALLATEMPGVTLRHAKCGFRVGRARPAWSAELDVITSLAPGEHCNPAR